METDFITCPNCEVELVIERRIVSLHGLDDDVADAVLDAYDQALEERRRRLAAIPTIHRGSSEHTEADLQQETISG